METMTLTITDIMEETRCQPRATLDPDMISTYHEDMHAGAAFPPLIVFHDGQRYWLADGYHRLAALKRRGATTACCDVRQGTIRDAILYAVGTNATHGLRRSNADKRRAVELLLGDDEWAMWSNAEVARRCAVSHSLVNDIRSHLEDSSRCEAPKTVTRNGATYEMHTENIGRRRTTAVDTDTGEVLDEADDGIEAEQVDPTDLASYLPDGTPALAPFEDAMAQHNAWLAAIRDDIGRMKSLADLARICDTLETTAKRMETLGIDAAETHRVHILAMMHMGRAIKAVIDAGFEAARAALTATTPTGAQVRGWLDAITAALDLIHPDFEGIDEVQQFIDALEAIDRWINHERGYLVEAMRDLEGELEKKRTAMAANRAK